MSNIGFTLRKLRAEGESVQPAEVHFLPGFNVIAGVSNSGKSYIPQCFDFMFGSENPPKDIEESRAYTRLFLEIEARGGGSYTLERSLKGGEFHLYEQKIDDITRTSVPRVLKSKPEPKPDNISSFLLSLCGVESAKIRKNAQNETANLSFRTFSHLFLIDETSIISEASPVLLKKGFADTKAKSAFNFVLTGIDDSSLIASPDKAIQQAQLAAKREVFNQLISDLEQTVASQKDDTTTLRKQIDEVKERIEKVSASISSSQTAIVKHQQARREAWIGRHEAESRLIVIGELLKRFDLLRKHYLSDLERLEFINEGDHYFEQLEFINCPLCGTPLESHALRKMCLNRGGQLANLATACREEAAKIRTFLRDLESTVSSLLDERRTMQAASEEKRGILKSCDRLIAEELRPKQLADASEFDRLMSNRQMLAEREMNLVRLRELREARVALDVAPVNTKPSGQAKGFDTFALRKLGDIIEGILEDWKFPEVGTVEFNEQQLDIVVRGKPRRSNGKGIRALLRAAFAIGLMRYCQANNRPHPGWVVLDSPLTTFREGGEQESNDEVPGEVQRAFFENLSLSPESEQIIVLENKEPSREVQARINFIKFSGKRGEGRAGFFPT